MEIIYNLIKDQSQQYITYIKSEFYFFYVYVNVISQYQNINASCSKQE